MTGEFFLNFFFPSDSGEIILGCRDIIWFDAVRYARHKSA